MQENDSKNYVTRVYALPQALPADAWDALLATQAHPTPFMRHAYLAALHDSGSATPDTGWTPRFLGLWQGGQLAAACPLYLKRHSWGEYVFDQPWARAYVEHGLAYYPKALVAVPFTPVPGTRLLARDATARQALIEALLGHCRAQHLSSLHLLFAAEEDQAACAQAGLMLRHTVQFHWKNMPPTLGTGVSSLPPEGARFALGRPDGETLAPTLGTGVSSLPPEGARFALGRPDGETLGPTLGTGAPFRDFDDLLASLSQDKRKKIRQERRKVREAGVVFRWARGADIKAPDWDFFYRCYERTYLEHGNPPYLSRGFFGRMADQMPENWLLFVAERAGRPIASSLIALDAGERPAAAYGRYWGALERVDCLHFEACYYQPLQWCIAHGVQRFEGGAQGEHKMARALLPVRAGSAHWLAHPAFADAVERYLAREDEDMAAYLEHLERRSPLRQAKGA